MGRCLRGDDLGDAVGYRAPAGSAADLSICIIIIIILRRCSGTVAPLLLFVPSLAENGAWVWDGRALAH